MTSYIQHSEAAQFNQLRLLDLIVTSYGLTKLMQ